MSFTQFPEYAQFLTDGYQVSSASAVERIEMDDGFIHQSPTQSLARYEIPLTYRLSTASEMESFEIWRRDVLHQGALYFAWPDVFYFAGNVKRRARIIDGKVTYKPLTDRLDDWTVSFNLEYYA